MTSNYEIKKGDIYYAMLDPVIGSEQDGKRPVVVIQNNLANKHSPTVIVAPITTVIKKTYLLTHIIIYKNNFLKKVKLLLVEVNNGARLFVLSTSFDIKEYKA